MSFFKKYPLITYELNANRFVVRDILRRSYFMSESKPYSNLFNEYNVPDGATPQSVAQEVYGSPYYHWVILMFNEINNPYFDWPIQQINLDRYCQEKYGIHTDGELIMFKTRHYEIDNIIVGFINQGTWQVPPTPLGLDGNPDQLAYPVTFYEYENEINDEKRKIKMLKPELLGVFVRQFEETINV